MTGSDADVLGEREKDEFRRLWGAGVKNIEISRHFGRKSRCWSSRMASSLGLPKRSKSNGRDILGGVDRSEFERLWHSGIPTADIARHFGRNCGSWASKVAPLLGLDLRPSGGSWNNALSSLDKGKFRRFWMSGMPLIEISRHFGRNSSSWASKTASRLGLPTKVKGRAEGLTRVELDPPSIIRLRSDGLTLTEIAKVVCCDVQVVRNCLDSMDMSANGPNDPKYAREDD